MAKIPSGVAGEILATPEPTTETTPADLEAISAMLAPLLQRLDALEVRMLQVEAMAHIEHRIGPETLSQITAAVKEDVQAYFARIFGHSGEPVR